MAVRPHLVIDLQHRLLEIVHRLPFVRRIPFADRHNPIGVFAIQQPETLSLILTVSVFDFQVCRIRSVRHLNHIST